MGIKKQIMAESEQQQEFDINFDGHILARIIIKDGKPEATMAMDGYGNGIDVSKIIITEV